MSLMCGKTATKLEPNPEPSKKLEISTTEFTLMVLIGKALQGIKDMLFT